MSDAAPAESPVTDTVAERIAQGAFLLVDKPRGPSSHQVTAWVRDLLGLDRAGHAGTLDPNVSGLLWIGVGPALRLLPLVLDFPKRYVAIVQFHDTVAPRELDRVLGEFQGPIYQLPPVRSAVRRERRIRTIHRLKLLERDHERVVLDIVADSGTYVRTLAVDLGEALGVGGHMAELRRIGTGPFREEDGVGLSALSDARARRGEGDAAPMLALLHPLEEVYDAFPRVLLKESAAAAVAHGANVASGGIVSIPRPFSRGAHVVLASRRGETLGFGRALRDSDEIASVKHGWVIDLDRVVVDAKRYGTVWRSRSAAPSAPAE